MADSRSCEDVDECKNYQLNQCDQFCVNTKGSFKCTCAEGYKIDHTDKRLCKPLDTSFKPYLLFCESQEIRTMDVDRAWEHVLITNTRRAVAIDYDFRDQRIYWSESDDPPLIKRAFFNGTGQEVCF